MNGSVLRYSLFVGSTLLALVSGCGSSSAPDDGSTNPGADSGLPFTGDASLAVCPQGNEAIQQAIIIPRCASCHGPTAPQAGLDLVSPGWVERMVNVPARECQGQTLLIPGDPVNSYFLHKISDPTPACGQRMPPTSMPINGQTMACLQAWVQGGLQPSDPSVPVPDYDAGPAWTPTPGTTPACSDADGRRLGSRMCPGADCMSCHRAGGTGDGVFSVAGTVFTNPTDPVTAGLPGLTVHVVDANNVMLDLTTNSAGNFYTTRRLTFPIHASVTNGATSIDMPIEAPNGACNSCHILPSVNGTAGRIYFMP